MTTKTKIIISIITLAVAFASGRYLSPTKVKTEVRTVEIEKIVVKIEHTTTTIREKPDGTKETIIVSDTTTDSKTNKESITELKEVTGSKDKLTISGLVGMNFSALGSPIYGASISKPLLGPIRLGIFGLTNKTFGVSIGLDL